MENRPGPERRDTRNKSKNVENLQLTDEERKVLRECRRNSLIRGVPAGIISALITKFAISSGKFLHLAQWSRFYYATSFTAGLLLGVSSYRKTCLEHIMQLENSAFAEQVREYYRRSGLEVPSTVLKQRETDSEFRDSSDVAYAYDSGTASELNTESTPHTRSEDKENVWHGSDDWRGDKKDETKPKTFAELRKENRQFWQEDQYPMRQKRIPFQRDSPKDEQGQDRAKNEPAEHNETRSQGSGGFVRRNKYGDPVE